MIHMKNRDDSGKNLKSVDVPVLIVLSQTQMGYNSMTHQLEIYKRNNDSLYRI
jgi:hypothetical protein